MLLRRHSRDELFFRLVTIILFLLGQTRGDSVTQLGGQVTLPEKAALTISCTYSASGEGPQLLLEATKDKEKGISKEFEATYHRKSKSFHLKKASVQESDSVGYYCALSDTEKGTAGGADSHSEQQRGLDAEHLTV
ncbi:hypothetical protein FD755_023815 [Muntiacus reevesi]|uniref:Ig-like domain-containing protein n=1 Tax=Muntiacus reevesi TaxID=9886 RepID=A0A5N3VWP1_MUNRE|nr:hypothetical protein FD755_023815 [Muntiacus reevesi]